MSLACIPMAAFGHAPWDVVQRRAARTPRTPRTILYWPSKHACGRSGSPEEPASYKEDGVLRTWLDGVLVGEETEMLWRLYNNVTISFMHMSTFFGGSDRTWASPQDQVTPPAPLPAPVSSPSLIAPRKRAAAYRHTSSGTDGRPAFLKPPFSNSSNRTTAVLVCVYHDRE